MDVRAVVTVASDAMELVAGLLRGIDVHHYRREIAQMVQRLVAHVHGDRVAFRNGMA